MRFLIDENLPAAILELLVSSGHETVYLPRTIHRGSSDDLLWRLAADEDRILVTRDLDFPLLDQDRQVPGLVLMRVPDTFNRQQVAAVFAEFMQTNDFQQLEGRVTVVSPGRSRSRKIHNA
jgi:predicted nuclease of predicted toxin-antitoxin system